MNQFTMLERHPESKQKMGPFKKIHHYRCGYVNKPHYRFWATVDPHMNFEKPLHPLKLTVWCGVAAFVLEIAPGQIETANSTKRHNQRFASFLKWMI